MVDHNMIDHEVLLMETSTARSELSHSRPDKGLVQVITPLQIKKTF